MLSKLINKLNMVKSKKGFTLIELVVVIVIIAILALIMVPNITSYIAKSQETRTQANLRQVYTSIQLVKHVEDQVTVKEDYAGFMALVADQAGISSEEIAKYTYEADTDKVYYYIDSIGDFMNYNGIEYGTGGIGD